MSAPKKSISEKFHAWKEERALRKEERTAQREERNLITTLNYEIGKLNYLITELPNAYDYAKKDKTSVDKWLEGDKGQFAPASPEQMLGKIETTKVLINKMLERLDGKGTENSTEQSSKFRKTLKDLDNIQGYIVRENGPAKKQTSAAENQATKSEEQEPPRRRM